MTQSEINKLQKNIATDFKIVTRKTELWDISFCYEILHDIKKLLTFGYLESASLMLQNENNNTIKVKKYVISSTIYNKDDRPGNIDWEDGEGHSLNIHLSYTQNYKNLSEEEKTDFHQNYLKGTWYPSNINVNFPHLSPSLSKTYTHLTSEVNRVDYN